jgi:uncharacterized protein
MRVIITGGTGLMGKILVPELYQNGYEVVVLSRNPASHSNSFPAQVQLHGWDARSADRWGHLADGAGAIVNLAGENLAGYGFFPKRWTESRKTLIRESRLQAGQAVVEAVSAAEKKPAVVIQASAVGYYGPLGDEIVTEDHPPADDFLARICVEWEDTTRAVETMGVRHLAIRTAGFLLSKDSGALPRLILPMKLYTGGPMGSGKQWYTWIHPVDAARAIRFLIENESVKGPVNLVSPEPLRNKDFSKAVGAALGRPSWLPIPGLAFDLAFGDVASVVLTGQRVVPARLQETGFSFDHTEAVEAIKDLLNG